MLADWPLASACDVVIQMDYLKGGLWIRLEIDRLESTGSSREPEEISSMVNF